MQVTGRSVEQKMDVRLRALRPVYINRALESKLPFEPEFIWAMVVSLPGLHE